jgi:Kef-type K+ transport system membrane component KefB
MPVLPLLAIGLIVLLLLHFDWQIYFAGGIALVLSAIAYAARQWTRATPS